MRTTIAIIFKFITACIASWLSFSVIDENPMNMILTVALAGTIVNYFLGELLIFQSMRTSITVIGDGVLAAVTAYVIDLFSNNFSTNSTELIIFAAVIATTEYFFHIYILKDHKVSPNEYHREHPLE